MPRRAVVTAAALALLAPPVDAAPKKRKKGKVVRVNRTRLVGAGLVRMCSNPRNDGGATCYGRPPRPGETGTVLDAAGVHGRVRVTEVVPALDGCGNEMSWEVKSTLESGDLANVSWNGAMMFDYKVGANARSIDNNGQIVIPTTRNSEQYLGAIDNQGDTIADLIVSWYPCDLAGNEIPAGGGGAYCIVYWQRAKSDYNQLRFDVVKNC